MINNLKITNKKEHMKLHKDPKKYIEIICPICKNNKLILKSFYRWKMKEVQKKFYNNIKNIDHIIIKGLKNKMTGYKIAKKYNLNRKTVYEHINKYIKPVWSNPVNDP